MILWVVLVAVLALWGLRFSGRSFHKDYLSKDATQPVKGIFILLVFVSHFSQYITVDGPLDIAYILFRKALGQMVVALFLFYSGYGVTVSFRRGGMVYLKRFPLQRLGKLHLQMIFAILLFWGTNLILGTHPGVLQVLLSTVGLDSLGNSDWYILAIFLCYLASFVSFLLLRKRPYLAAAMITALSCACILVLRQGREAYFYNTFLSYAAGVVCPVQRADRRFPAEQQRTLSADASCFARSAGGAAGLHGQTYHHLRGNGSNVRLYNRPPHHEVSCHEPRSYLCWGASVQSVYPSAHSDEFARTDRRLPNGMALFRPLPDHHRRALVGIRRSLRPPVESAARR